MTLSLAAVFIPVLFMGGMVGRLFREFAVTIGVAVLVSGFVSLTLTPMLSSRFLQPPRRDPSRPGLCASPSGSSRACCGSTSRTLRWVLRHRRTAMLFSLAILAATVCLFMHIPKGFLPSEDRARFMGSTEAAEGISFESMVEHQQAVAAILQQDPDVESFMSSAGARGSSGRQQRHPDDPPQAPVRAAVSAPTS